MRNNSLGRIGLTLRAFGLVPDEIKSEANKVSKDKDNMAIRHGKSNGKSNSLHHGFPCGYKMTH